jgi:hypothetical protein
MRRNRSTRYALQVAACPVCLKTVDLSADCYRRSRKAGGIAHVHCLVIGMTDADGVRMSDAEMAESLNENAEALCSALCENGAHPLSEPRQVTCRQDGWIVREDYAIGCTPDVDDKGYAFDHFHAVIDGAACPCRHETHADARSAHGLPVED